MRFVAGSDQYTGLADGVGGQVLFGAVTGMTSTTSGLLVLVDLAYSVLRVANYTTGQVETICGSTDPGFSDGLCSNANTVAFNQPYDIARRPNTEELWISELSGHIRKGVWEQLSDGSLTLRISTAFNQPDVIASPAGLAFDANGDLLYVADHALGGIWVLYTEGGVVGTVEQLSSAAVAPWRVAWSWATPDLFVTGGNSTPAQPPFVIRRVQPDGQAALFAQGLQGEWAPFVATLGSAGVRGAFPLVLSANAGTQLYLSDSTGSSLSLLAGTGELGFANGPPLSSQFRGLLSAHVDTLHGGRLFVMDTTSLREIVGYAGVPPSASATPSVTPTGTDSGTPSPSCTSTGTPSPSGSDTWTPSSSATGTPSPTGTPSQTATVTPSSTGSESGTTTPSATSTETPTTSSTATPTPTPSRTPTPVPIVSLLAGSGQSGFLDGTGDTARFSAIVDMAQDSTGAALMVADSGVMRRVVIETGSVTTVCGTPADASTKRVQAGACTQGGAAGGAGFGVASAIARIPPNGVGRNIAANAVEAYALGVLADCSLRVLYRPSTEASSDPSAGFQLAPWIGNGGTCGDIRGFTDGLVAVNATVRVPNSISYDLRTGTMWFLDLWGRDGLIRHGVIRYVAFDLMGGEYVGSLNAVAQTLANPVSMAFLAAAASPWGTSDASLWVVNGNGGSLYRVDPVTQTMLKVASGLNAAGFVFPATFIGAGDGSEGAAGFPLVLPRADYCTFVQWSALDSPYNVSSSTILAGTLETAGFSQGPAVGPSGALFHSTVAALPNATASASNVARLTYLADLTSLRLLSGF